jgi:hypothetical protein
VRRALSLAIAAAALTGCFADRERPRPFDPTEPPELTALVLMPQMGATVRSGQDVTVRVQARDLNTGGLAGVGFFARRFGGGSPTVDSAAISFEARSDTTHEFSFIVPPSYPTNTQIDIYGIAFGVGGETRLSAFSAVVVVQCSPVPC